jgi:hypothetical protein
MAGYNVAPENLATAKAAYDAGWNHFNALADAFGKQVQNANALKAFEGGHGVEGHYQKRFARFGEAWVGMIDKFVTDEHKFAAFLGGFSQRLGDTHDLYLEVEAQHAQMFDDINKTLKKDG